MFCSIAYSQFERIFNRLNGAKDAGPLCYIGAINLTEKYLNEGKEVTYFLGSHEYGWICHAWIEVDGKIYDTNRYRNWSETDLISTEKIILSPKDSLETNFQKLKDFYKRIYRLVRND